MKTLMVVTLNYTSFILDTSTENLTLVTKLMNATLVESSGYPDYEWFELGKRKNQDAKKSSESPWSLTFIPEEHFKKPELETINPATLISELQGENNRLSRELDLAQAKLQEMSKKSQGTKDITVL